MKALSLRIGMLLSTLLGVWGLSPCRIGVVLGHSMAPTLGSGQLIAIERDYYRAHGPQPGEIVVFRHAGTTYVKRVYAVEGETIFFLTDGKAGARTLLQPVCCAQVERVRAAVGRQSILSVRRLRIPPGSFFALGDALNNSIDSRDLGPIANEELIGRVQPLFGAAPAPEPEISLPPAPRQAAHPPHRHSANA